jgi:predicted Zn-dependent protease
MRSLWRNLRRVGEKLVDRLTEAQRDGVRAAALLFLVAGLGAAGYFLGWPVWRNWQTHRALAQAQGFARSGDTRSLVLALQRATQLAPENMATWRETARLLDEVNSPDTMEVRQQLVQMAPRDMGQRLALAQDALKFGRFDTAESAVAGMSVAARQDLAYHRLAASLAASLGRNDDLEKEAKAILALKPDDLDAGFTYATVRMWGTDPVASAAGRTDLEKFLTQPTVRVRAALELLSEASHEQKPVLVRDVLYVLLARFAPGAAADFSSPGIPGWRTLIDAIKSAAAPSPGDAVLVARWLAGMGQATEALAWIDSLPAAIQNAAAMRDVTAQICAEKDDLPRLGRLLRSGAWGDWPVGAQALALAARLQILRFSESRGRQTWDDAIAACHDSLTGLRALARLASIWNYFDGEERVLRGILRQNPKIYWAYGALRTLYRANNDLPPLYDLYSAWSAQLPDDASVASARIMLGCILDRAGPDAIARAADLRQRFPDELAVQLASAAALWRGGRPQEAWAILAPLPPGTRERQDVSFWAALIQADLGHSREAIAAIRRAVPAVSSVEERSLLEAAAVKAGITPPSP